MGAVLSAQSVAVWWAVVGVAVSVTVALVVGPVLRRRSKDYPPADGLDNEGRPL